MKESGDREGSTVTGQGVRCKESQEIASAPSISRIDEDDVAILSSTREGQLILLQISEKTDMPFMECLKRAKRLETLGLLSKVADALSPEGLHYYSRTKPDCVWKRNDER